MRHQRSFKAFVFSSSVLLLMTTAFNRFAVVLLNVAFNFSGAALASVVVIATLGIRSVVGSPMAASPTPPNPYMEGYIQECS
jgi:hypothetical protein